MNLVLRLLLLISCFLLLPSSMLSQKDYGKFFFPKNKDARWLMSHFGKASNFKTLKKFNKKYGGDNDPEEPTWNYQARKKGLFLKLNSEDGADGTSHYDGLYIEKEDEDVAAVTFMGSTQKSEVLKKIATDKDIETLDSDEGGIILLVHSTKIFVQVDFNTGGKKDIYSIALSAKGYSAYYKERERKKLEEQGKEALASTDFRFQKTSIHILPQQVRVYNPKEKDLYQIINLLYEGPLKDGVPHGEGKWGIFKGDICPPGFEEGKLEFTAKGQFEAGKPVGMHKNEPYFAYTYEGGQLRKIDEVDGDFFITFKEDGSPNEAGAIYVNYGGKSGKYYGKINNDEKPNDEAGVIYLNYEKVKITTSFVNGALQKGAKATFDYFERKVVLTAHINEKLEMDGKIEIRGTKENDAYSGFVYLRNGQLDSTQEGQLTFDNFYLSDQRRGKCKVSGKIEMKDFARGYFQGKDVALSFTDHPDAQFKGTFAASRYSVRPIGWHTLTQRKNGVVQNTLKGRYSPKGGFLEGENFYQRAKAEIYDSGYFTDSRNGKEYPYKTIVRPNGQLITWMMKNIYYEGNVGNVWGYGRGKDHRANCYYSKSKSRMACPRGWRLPSLDDVNEIKDKNTQDKKWITDNTTLISFLDLERNGYVWTQYRGEQMYQQGEGIFFWLNSGNYISISHLNQGTYTSLNADERFHICRCVKDGAL